MAAARFAKRIGRRLSPFRAPARLRSLRAEAAGPMLLALGLALSVAGCHTRRHEEPVTASASRPLTEVLAAHTPELMKLSGVVGTAESRLDDGRPCILVMVIRLTPELRSRIPGRLEGWPVRIDETGRIHAMPDSGR